MAFKRVTTKQNNRDEELIEQEDIQPTKQFKRVEKPNPYYDSAKQVAYQGVRGAVGTIGDLAELAVKGVSKGLEYVGVPKNILDVANEVYSYIAPQTSKDIDALAEELGINPRASTTPGRIAGNVADTLASGYILGAPAKALTYLGLGEAAGDLAVEAGAPEEVGLGIKVGTSLLGGKSSKLIGTKKQKPVINFLRKYGFTDEQITPLIQDPRKLQTITKIAFKGGKPYQIARELQEAIGGIYDTIRTEGNKLGILTNPEKTNLINNLYSIRDKIPLKWQKLINPIIQRFENSRGKASDLVNLYQDIGAEVAGQQGGKAILNLFKDPAANGLGLISSELSSDFKLANQLYGLNKKFQKAFKPTMWSNLNVLNIGQATRFLKGLVTLDFSSLAKDLGIVAARKLSTQLLTNPKLQNITKRIISNINDNKSSLVVVGIKNLIKEINKIDPETAKEIEKSTISTSDSKT